MEGGAFDVLSGATAAERALLMCIERLDALEARHELLEARHRRVHAALLMVAKISPCEVYAELVAFLFGLSTAEWWDLKERFDDRRRKFFRENRGELDEETRESHVRRLYFESLREGLAGREVPERAAQVHRACTARTAAAFEPVWEAEWDADETTAFHNDLDASVMLGGLATAELDAFWKWHMCWNGVCRADVM